MEELVEADKIEVGIEADGARTPVVKLVGEIDVSNADLVQGAIDRSIEDQRQQVAFDLSDLRFMDSSGLAVLLRVAKRVAVVELRNPAPIVRRIIQITGVSSVFVVSS